MSLIKKKRRALAREFEAICAEVLKRLEESPPLTEDEAAQILSDLLDKCEVCRAKAAKLGVIMPPPPVPRLISRHN